MSQQNWSPPSQHPVLACVAGIDAAFDEVGGVDPEFMSTSNKRAALLGLAAVEARLAALKLRLLAQGQDIALADGSRDLAAWRDHQCRVDRSTARTEQRVAETISTRWPAVRAAMARGAVSLGQAAVITRALDALPELVSDEVTARAEERLVAEAHQFGPKELAVMGRRILDVVAPEVGEQQERTALEGAGAGCGGSDVVGRSTPWRWQHPAHR